jgi:phosphatidylserine/phosphatidylglycerophosphate/cardiolipin synthase-like enzyme
VDRARVFIRSFNFDPRSAKRNTKMGFVIDSPALAQRIAAAFDSTMPAHACEVRLSEPGSCLGSSVGESSWCGMHGARHELLAMRRDLVPVAVADRVAVVSCATRFMPFTGRVA